MNTQRIKIFINKNNWGNSKKEYCQQQQNNSTHLVEKAFIVQKQSYKIQLFSSILMRHIIVQQLKAFKHSVYLLTFAKSPRSTARRYFFSSSVNGFGKFNTTSWPFIICCGGMGDGPLDGTSIWRLTCVYFSSWISFMKATYGVMENVWN